MIRIATWNLDEASTTNNKRASYQLEKIKEINADIWVLTETKSTISLSDLGYDFVASTPNIYNKNYVAIWSRFPINKIIKTYDQEITSCCKIELPDNQSIIVYGTIITYLADKGTSGQSKNGEEHLKAIINQGKDWEIINKKEECTIFCVAGDFNQPRDGSDWYQAHTSNKAGVSELTKQLDKNNLECVTAEDFYSTGRLIDRHSVDHICLTKNQITLNTVDIWQDTYDGHKNLSDHNGVYIDFSLNIN